MANLPAARCARSVLQRYALEGLTSQRVPVTPTLTVQDYFASPGTISDWTMMGLPSDTHSVQNGLLVTESRKSCILIDPQGQGLRWIVNLETQAKQEALAAAARAHVSPAGGAVAGSERRSSVSLAPPVATKPVPQLKSHGSGKFTPSGGGAASSTVALVTPIRQGGDRFREVLETAVQEGEVVIVADVDSAMHPLLESVLDQRVVSKGAAKLLCVGDNLVELHPGFKYEPN